MKHKTLSVYLALFLGTYGVHRFYLKGWRDLWAWLHVLFTSIGLIGLRRAWAVGQDDRLAWLLLPFLGVSLFVACFAAISYGLTPAQKWAASDEPNSLSAASTTGLTVFGVILALLVGATALMSAIAYTSHRYFEFVIKSS